MGVVERIPNTSNVGKLKEYLKTHDSENVIPEATTPTEHPPPLPHPAPADSVSGRGGGSSHLTLMVYPAEQLRV